MPKRIPSTSKSRRNWFLHLLVFIIGNAIMWTMTYAGAEGWVYPWPAWPVAAWSLLVIGHACLVWYNYEDKNYDKWVKETQNG